MSNIHLGLPYPGGGVDHSSNLANDIGVLYLNDEYSDVTLQVNGQAFHAHKVILAARSQYFRSGIGTKFISNGKTNSSSTCISTKQQHEAYLHTNICGFWIEMTIGFLAW